MLTPERIAQRNRSSDIARWQRWLTALDEALAGALDLFRDPSEVDMADAWAVFDGLVKAHPGSMSDKFRTMGSPPLLAHYCGMRATPLTPREVAMYAQQEQTGWLNDPARPADGRAKPVIEPATGATWPSATALADEMGANRATLYHHLRGDPRYKTVKGRTFEYVEKDPDTPLPGSLAAMTEAEKEKMRALARSHGFEPKF